MLSLVWTPSGRLIVVVSNIYLCYNNWLCGRVFSKKVRRSRWWYILYKIHIRTRHTHTTGLHLRLTPDTRRVVGRASWQEVAFRQPVFVIRGLPGASRTARRQQQVKRDLSWPEPARPWQRRLSPVYRHHHHHRRVNDTASAVDARRHRALGFRETTINEVRESSLILQRYRHLYIATAIIIMALLLTALCQITTNKLVRNSARTPGSI